MPKYVFITGGVVSSLGKGITAASLGLLLQSRGFKVAMAKFDPYINVDPGTMNPYQHGEVYVLDDGAETDLDLGHYERFTGLTLNKKNNVTTGKIYNSVITKERRGDFLGGTVQVIPHITDEIKSCIRAVGEDPGVEVIIIEIGGTVGDIESLPFLEAIRQFRLDVGRDNTLYLHLTLVPLIRAAGELKTKPTQHSVRELREIGIQPDILLCRTEVPLSPELREKISLFCNVEKDAVIEGRDIKPIYRIPTMFKNGGLDDIVIRMLRLEPKHEDMAQWRAMVAKLMDPSHEVKVAVVGKYVGLKDAYKSIDEALTHGGIANDAKVEVSWVDAEEFEHRPPEELVGDVHGILVAPGFGSRGIEGKIAAVQYAREKKVPFLGICLGMQLAVVEFARNVCGLNCANSTEVTKDTPHPVICLLSEQENIEFKGGTMRLGAYPCCLSPGSRALEAYGQPNTSERHRHRYELNNKYRSQLEAAGMRMSGLSPDGELVEIIEIPSHPWFVASQFHPEFRSRPINPQPLFSAFIGAALRHAQADKSAM